jgi:hypothetical protein
VSQLVIEISRIGALNYTQLWCSRKGFGGGPRRLLAHLGIHGRRPWRRLSGVVLSWIGLPLWAGAVVVEPPGIGRFFFRVGARSTVFKECIMFTLAFPSILSHHLRQLEYGLQPVRVPPDDRFVLIIKMSKEAILTARLNQQIKIYLIPDISTQGGLLGLITAFFDDHDEPMTLTTPLFRGDAMLRDLSSLLGQEAFDLYFFDEHDRELMGVRARNADAARLREEMLSISFPMLDMNRVPTIVDAMRSWFGLRGAADDERAFVIGLGERLYHDDFVIIDARVHPGRLTEGRRRRTEGLVTFRGRLRAPPSLSSPKEIILPSDP